MDLTILSRLDTASAADLAAAIIALDGELAGFEAAAKAASDAAAEAALDDMAGGGTGAKALRTAREAAAEAATRTSAAHLGRRRLDVALDSAIRREAAARLDELDATEQEAEAGIADTIGQIRVHITELGKLAARLNNGLRGFAAGAVIYKMVKAIRHACKPLLSGLSPIEEASFGAGSQDRGSDPELFAGAHLDGEGFRKTLARVKQERDALAAHDFVERQRERLLMAATRAAAPSAGVASQGLPFHDGDTQPDRRAKA